MTRTFHDAINVSIVFEFDFGDRTLLWSETVDRSFYSARQLHLAPASPTSDRERDNRKT
ncbi:MAG: hypothetical protein SWY16_14310 [Cyanobacteriota bacterium]|nr:hypothetical protein [Cyanobacteriota bacterium]